jgi:hypothetical protein
LNNFLDDVTTLQESRREQQLTEQRQNQLVASFEAIANEIRENIKLLKGKTEPEVASIVAGIETKLKTELTKALKGLSTEIKVYDNNEDVVVAIHRLTNELKTKDTTPKVNVAPAEVSVTPEVNVDLDPLLKKLEQLKKALSKPTSNSDITKGLSKVETAVRQLIAKPIPVANFPGTIKVTDRQGNDILDPTAGYAPSDIDEAGSTKYYGFLSSDGRWYVMRNVSDTTFRYASGDSDYADSWTNRASLTYDYFSEVF